MFKKLFLVLILALIAVLFSSCISAPNLLSQQTINTTGKEIKPEEAVKIKLEKLGYNYGESYKSLVIGNYIFLLYNDVGYLGCYFEDEGYKFYVPLGIKSNVAIPDSDELKGVIDLINISRIRDDYIIEMMGKKENSRILVTDPNSPIKIYSNYGDFKPLFDEDGNQINCNWIDVENGMMDDYQVYVDYNGKTYPLLNAKQIKKLVG